MKLPDGNKPIKVGDTSYIYKGVYNPIYWVGKDPYRPRVETLVIKDGRYLYADISDDIDSIPPNERNHSYSVPGGSLDADSTKIEQAEAETNEEALVKVTLLYHSGITYYDLYEPGFILKGGDTPLEYVGSITDVYVGVYNGLYDKSLVEEKDLDPKMAEHGGFHDIKSIAKYLRKEHIDALLHSQFVADDVKIALGLSRKDVINESASPILVPDKYIYHGSDCKIEEFKPMSLDLGNALEGPGWSTFCFDNFESAKLFGFMKTIIHYMHNVCNETITPRFTNGKIILSEEDFNKYKRNSAPNCPRAFFVYTIDSEGLNIGIGNDPTLKEFTFRESGVKPVTVDSLFLSMVDLKENIEIVDKYFEPTDTSDYKYLQTHNYWSENKVKEALLSAIADGKLKPGDNIEKYMEENNISFENDDIPLPEIIFDVDQPVLEDIDISSVLEESYPIDCYGLPERKAYPMPDEKHVRSAIKFFNYASKDEEKELAEKINDKIKEFKIKDINIGDNNRFKKYYKPINENYSVEDYATALKSLLEQVQTNIAPKKKYAIYEQAKGVIRMMIAQLESGGFEDVSEDAIGRIVNQSYIALAEISQNQIELMSSDKVSLNSIMENSSRSIMYVLEADDDNTDDEDETATDYDQMADDMDDTNNNTDDSSDDSGDTGEDETATDYDQMADEQDTSDEDNPVDDNEGEIDDTTSDDTGTIDESDTSDDSSDNNDTGDTGEDETATDYDQMADEQDTSGDDMDESDSGDETDEPTDSSDDSSSDDTTSDDTTETDENNNRYDNKELKNYFLLNSFLSMHETVVDVLDTTSGVILPTPDANSVMGKVVKNLQSIKNFVEKFIQFHFSDSDYAFNLYYYNILISALNINLKMLEAAMEMGEAKITKTKKEEK